MSSHGCRARATLSVALLLVLLAQSVAAVTLSPATRSPSAVAIGEASQPVDALAVGPERPGTMLGIGLAREGLAPAITIAARRIALARVTPGVRALPIPHARSHTVRHASRADDPAPH